MYKIIGGDQQEYGPISADQVRAWFREGRLNAQTRARAEGSDLWQPLSSFPEFADCFGFANPGATPAPFPSAPPVDDSAARAVRAPAIALIVVASIGILYYLANSLFILAGGHGMVHQSLPPNLSPQMRAFFEGMRGHTAGLLSLGIVAINAFVLFGAANMLRCRSWGLAVAACIAAMLPCQCCCLVGLPLGIWGLVTIMRPEVKPSSVRWR